MTDFNLTEFLAMGGYAPFVWSSWAITLIGMSWLVWHAVAKRKKILTDLHQQVQQQAARNKRQKTVNSNNS